MTIWFDMDGTIANLYGEKNWLENILDEKTTCYANAKPLVNVIELARKINELKELGIQFGIISWTARDGRTNYNKRVRAVKVKWLERYLPNCFDTIHIVKYGTPKEKFAIKGDILFDDEIVNRDNWGINAFDENELAQWVG